MHRVITITASALTLIACGDDAPSDAVDASDSTASADSADAPDPFDASEEVREVPIDELASAIGVMYCKAVFACPYYRSMDNEWYAGAMWDARKCLENVDFSVEADALARRVTAGALTYDPEAMGRCAKSVGCEWFAFDLFANVCADVFDGTVALGGACQEDSDCLGDAHCSFSGESCPGTCEAGVALGGACADDSECARDSAAVKCHDGVCRVVSVAAASDPGGPCGASVVGDALQIQGCDDGFCTDEKTCIALLAEGEACDSNNSACELGMTCGGHTGGGCAPVTVEKKLGAQCGYLEDRLIICDDTAGLVCGTVACEALKRDGAIGEVCFPANTTYCAAGTYCQATEDPEGEGQLFHCAEYAADGVACYADEDCASGRCDFVDEFAGTCATSACEL